MIQMFKRKKMIVFNFKKYSFINFIVVWESFFGGLVRSKFALQENDKICTGQVSFRKFIAKNVATSVSHIFIKLFRFPSHFLWVCQ